MAIHLKSINEPTKYFTGTVLKTKKNFTFPIAIFTESISNAREFLNREEADKVSDEINVPVTIVEV